MHSVLTRPGPLESAPLESDHEPTAYMLVVTIRGFRLPSLF
jgi:hypothetical protein